MDSFSMMGDIESGAVIDYHQESTRNLMKTLEIHRSDVIGIYAILQLVHESRDIFKVRTIYIYMYRNP